MYFHDRLLIAICAFNNDNWQPASFELEEYLGFEGTGLSTVRAGLSKLYRWGLVSRRKENGMFNYWITRTGVNHLWRHGLV